MIVDKLHTKDGVIAGLAPYTAPRFSCPKCGKETKDAGVRGDSVPNLKRSCRNCNIVFTLASINQK